MYQMPFTLSCRPCMAHAAARPAALRPRLRPSSHPGPCRPLAKALQRRGAPLPRQLACSVHKRSSLTLVSSLYKLRKAMAQQAACRGALAATCPSSAACWCHAVCYFPPLRHIPQLIDSDSLTSASNLLCEEALHESGVSGCWFRDVPACGNGLQWGPCRLRVRTTGEDAHMAGYIPYLAHLL